MAGMTNRGKPIPVAGRGLSWPWKRVAAGIAGIVVLLIVAWVAWSLVRSNPKGFAPTAGAAGTTIEAPAELQFTADARSREDWVFFSFATGAVLETTQDALDWDLAFRRSDVLVNGGATNPLGQGAVIDLGEVPLAGAAAPATGYVVDIEHEDRGLENPEMHGWYNYDWTTHVISSKNHTYAMRTADGEGTVLLTYLSYYCEDRTAACITFKYMEVE